MALAGGRTTIALTPEADSVVDALCDRYPFRERLDAAKFGIAYAIRRDLEPTRPERASGGGPPGTTWGVAGFDTDGKLRELVQAVFPTLVADPYVTLESLMNRGLVAIDAIIRERQPRTLAELVDLAD